jgi:hypothetical protein
MITSKEINELVWRAVIDPDFQKDLLNGRRDAVLASLDLTEAEREAVLALEADTLDGFVAALFETLSCSPYAGSRPRKGGPDAGGLRRGILPGASAGLPVHRPLVI